MSMESDQSGPENSEETIVSSTTATLEEQQQQQQQQQSTTNTTGAVRSYECNFCKRGFTNAQALGGHMNIHRKDKAKFKQSGTSSNVVIDSHSPTRQRLIIYPESNTKNIPIPIPIPTTTITTTTTTPAANPFSISPQGNWFPSPPQDEKKPLPLFGDDSGSVSSSHQESVKEDPPEPEPEPEVDLELRLGHVESPSESSSGNKGAAATTRKFF